MKLKNMKSEGKINLKKAEQCVFEKKNCDGILIIV